MINTYIKKKIVLFIPNSRWHNKRPWISLPYAILILSALLKEKFDLSIIDANGNDLTEEQSKAILSEAKPAAVLVSGFSVEYFQQSHTAMAIAKEVCPETITVLGGVYPTVLGEEAIKDLNIDYIFIGHAENRVNEFLERILSHNKNMINVFPGIGFRDDNCNVIINPVTSYISDVKQMVNPDYSLINIEPYLNKNTLDYQFNSKLPSATIITSYGCPFNCIFCATRTISGRRVVYRTVDDVLEEIEYLISNHNVRNLVFLDDCLLANRTRINTLLNAFTDNSYNLNWKAATVSAWHLDEELLELMRNSGCTQITVSVESGSPRVLNEIINKPLKLEIIPGIVKKCKELGIDIGANFVIGLPGETWDELRETFSFAEYCDFDVVHFHIATPLPKTDLYRIAKEQSLLPPDFSFTNPRFFGFGQGFITTEEFTPSELMILRSYEWDRINFKTTEKIEKIAQMYNTTIEKLNEHRKQTRLKCGIHF
ncbi:MAG: B12-binding domain-containing radical SAM protein [Bacillota bacterium]